VQHDLILHIAPLRTLRLIKDGARPGRSGPADDQKQRRARRDFAERHRRPSWLGKGEGNSTSRDRQSGILDFDQTSKAAIWFSITAAETG
jgi:hypothetical protein